MKRIVLLMAMLFAIVGTNVSAKDKVIKWKIATTWGTTTVPHIDIAKEMAEMVKEMSDGKFIIEVHSSSKHRAPYGVFDMVKQGHYDMGHTASYYWKGKDPATVPLASMPFGMTTNQLHTWFKYGGGQELMDKVYSRHGMRSFLGGNTGKQMIWFKKPIKTVEDLKGLKIRMPGFAGEVVADAGGLVVNMASGELYMALERGAIDALEWCSPGTDIKMGFNDIAKYYYIGFHEDSTELQYLVNEKKWDSLPKKYQEILKHAMEISADNFYYKNYADNVKAWNLIVKKNKDIQLLKFPKSVIDALKAANERMIDKWSNKSPLFKEIVDSQKAFMEASKVWSDTENTKY